MSREAMQMALEALESAKMNHGKMLLSDPPQEAWRFHRVDETLSDAITALRVALAEPEQEPVAWISEGGNVSRSKRYMDEMGFKCNPLYTALPKREWVGLTDEEIHDLSYLSQKIDASNSPWFDRWGFAQAIEAEIRRKNT